MDEYCLKIEPLLAGYALEALSDEEKTMVEAHIETCDACRLAVADYRAVSDGFLGATPPMRPPDRLRARVLAEIEPQRKPVRKLSQLFNVNPRLTTAIGVLTILISVGLNIYFINNTGQMIGDYQNLVQQNQAYQTSMILLADPNSQIAVVNEPDLTGTLVYDPDGQLAILNVQGLAALAEGQTYQVWLIEADETRISGGLFNAWDEAGSASFVIHSPSSLETFVGIGVTIEPEGGSPGPTGPRVFGVEL
jgi:anti-sigma-K factor RskA